MTPVVQQMPVDPQIPPGKVQLQVPKGNSGGIKQAKNNLNPGTLNEQHSASETQSLNQAAPVPHAENVYVEIKSPKSHNKQNKEVVLFNISFYKLVMKIIDNISII